MKELIFADGRRTEIQSANTDKGILRIRMILTTSETLKALFADTFATSKMIMRENYKEVKSFENYTILKYIKEETGGIWEVELSQTEADISTRMADVEVKTQENAANLEMAIAELSIIVGTIAEAIMGGEENV